MLHLWKTYNYRYIEATNVLKFSFSLYLMFFSSYYSQISQASASTVLQTLLYDLYGKQLFHCKSRITAF